MERQWEIYEKESCVRLVTNEKDFFKYTSRPTHITHKIFDRNFAAIHEIKPVLMLNKPIYVPINPVHCSRIKQRLMYDFHYNFFKKNFDPELLFTDTFYEIKSEDVHEEFFKQKHLFDFSNYPKDSKVF